MSRHPEPPPLDPPLGTYVHVCLIEKLIVVFNCAYYGTTTDRVGRPPISQTVLQCPWHEFIYPHVSSILENSPAVRTGSLIVPYGGPTSGEREFPLYHNHAPHLCHNHVPPLCYNHVPPCATTMFPPCATTMFYLVLQPCSPLVPQPGFPLVPHCFIVLVGSQSQSSYSFSRKK